MEFTRKYLPLEWEERWRREKERQKRMIEEGGEKFEEENRKLKWIMSYNDSRIGMKEKLGKENESYNMEDYEPTRVYQRQRYPHEIFQTLAEMRMEDILTDLTLITEDGVKLCVHGLVLAAVSSLVQETLQERDGDEKEVLLSLGPEVQGSGLGAVVEFAYTGAICFLEKDNMNQIQSAAESLGVLRVLELLKVEEEGGKKDELKKISADEHMKVGLQAMKELWSRRVGCDVELVAEGTVFCAHRALLAASSDYFRGMFTSGMKESRQESVSLLLVGAAEFEPLLQCAYSGSLELGWTCVFELACTALQFQFQPAISLCLQFLEQEIDVYNCLDVASFSEAYGMPDLMELAEDFVLRHFQEVSVTPKFQDLPADKLLQFLRCDALSIPSELAVFRAVVTWVEADPTERLPQAEELMRAVRFPFMTFREFREVRAVNLSMECSGEVEVDLYKSALKEFGFGISDRVAQQRVRHPKDALVLVGGDQLDTDMGVRLPSKQLWFANSLRSGIGLRKEIEWRMLGEMPDQARFRHAVGVLDGQLYVAGGCHYYAKSDIMKSVYRYDPVRDSWKRLADLQELRSNFTMVVSGDSLYAVGGDKDINTNLDSVERYTPETDSWSFSRPLDQALSGHAATVWGGEIFISGGFNCKYECLVSMFHYHPVRGTTYLSNMIHDRAQHCMESLRNRFYVAGGVCNHRKYYTDQLACEIYNPVRDCWTSLTPLPVPHVGAASAVLEERLYVLGGYCQEDYSEARLAHRYDPVTQRWESMGTMPGPVTDIRACLLHLPEHVRK